LEEAAESHLSETGISLENHLKQMHETKEIKP